VLSIRQCAEAFPEQWGNLDLYTHAAIPPSPGDEGDNIHTGTPIADTQFVELKARR